MAGSDWKLEDDNGTVTATFATNPSVTLKLCTADLENMLKDLGAFRWEMQPEAPESEPVLDPAWETARTNPWRTHCCISAMLVSAGCIMRSLGLRRGNWLNSRTSRLTPRPRTRTGWAELALP